MYRIGVHVHLTEGLKSSRWVVGCDYAVRRHELLGWFAVSDEEETTEDAVDYDEAAAVALLADLFDASAEWSDPDAPDIVYKLASDAGVDQLVVDRAVTEAESVRRGGVIVDE